jgi:hypothetical protein
MEPVGVPTVETEATVAVIATGPPRVAVPGPLMVKYAASVPTYMPMLLLV